MMKKLLPLIAIFFLLINTPAFAFKKDSDENGSEHSNKSRFEVKINGNVGSKDSNSDNGTSHIKLKLEVDDGEFDVRGQITSVSGNSFVIGGQTIEIDPSKVDKFKQKGILAEGNMAKVEGIIIGGDKFAEKISLIGTGQGRFKFEISGLTFIASPTPSIDPSATPSASPDVSPSPTVSANAKVKIKAVGPIDQVLSFLGQILGFLTGFGPSPSPSPIPDVSPTPDVSPSPTASPTPTPEVSPTPNASPTPSVSPSPSPTNTVNAQVKIKAEGPIEVIISFLGSIISFLTGLGSNPTPSPSPTL